MLKSTFALIALGLLTGSWSMVVKRQAEGEEVKPLEGPPQFPISGPQSPGAPPQGPPLEGPPQFPPGPPPPFPPPGPPGSSECPTPATVESFDADRVRTLTYNC